MLGMCYWARNRIFYCPDQMIMRQQLCTFLSHDWLYCTYTLLWKQVFCSTSFLLASTRWVWSKLSSLCPFSYNQCHLLTFATVKYIFGTAKNRTRGPWVRSRNATSVQCSPTWYNFLYEKSYLMYLNWSVEMFPDVHFVEVEGELFI